MKDALKNENDDFYYKIESFNNKFYIRRYKNNKIDKKFIKTFNHYQEALSERNKIIYLGMIEARKKK